MWAGSHKLQKQNWLLRRFRSRVSCTELTDLSASVWAAAGRAAARIDFFKCRGDGLWIDSLVGAEHSLPHCTESAALTQRHTRALQQEAGCENITSVTLCECVSAGLCVWAWIYYITVNEWLRLFQSMWSECVRVCVRLNRGNEAAFSLCHVAQSLRVCKWHKFTDRYTCEDLHWDKGRQSKQVLQRSDHRASDRAVSKSGRNDHTSHLVYHLNKHFGQLMASVTGIRSYWIKHDVLSILFTGRPNRGWNRVCV